MVIYMKLEKRKGITIIDANTTIYKYYQEVQVDMMDRLIYGTPGMYYKRFSGSILTEVLDEECPKVLDIWAGGVSNMRYTPVILGEEHGVVVANVDTKNGTITVGKK